MQVQKLSKNEILMVNIGSLTSGGRVLAVKADLAKIGLTSPVCTEVGEKIALSRRVEKHWRCRDTYYLFFTRLFNIYICIWNFILIFPFKSWTRALSWYPVHSIYSPYCLASAWCVGLCGRRPPMLLFGAKRTFKLIYVKIASSSHYAHVQRRVAKIYWNVLSWKSWRKFLSLNRLFEKAEKKWLYCINLST